MTPEIAAKLLEAMSSGRAYQLSRLVRDGKFDYINGIFSRIPDEKLNDIYPNLTKRQKEELLPHLSAGIKGRIVLKKPITMIHVIGIVEAMAIVGVIFAYLRRRIGSGLFPIMANMGISFPKWSSLF